MKKVTNAANGSTFLEISKTAFKNIECSIPEENVLDRFENLVIPIFDKLLLNIKEIQTLSQIKNTLLPKLMNGEIRVKGFDQ